MKPINYDDMFLCFQAVNDYTEKRFTLKNEYSAPVKHPRPAKLNSTVAENDSIVAVVVH